MEDGSSPASVVTQGAQGRGDGCRRGRRRLGDDSLAALTLDDRVVEIRSVLTLRLVHNPASPSGSGTSSPERS